MTAFLNAHASLAPLTVRELEFLLDVGAIRLEQLREFEDAGREREETEPALSLAA
jgi:hypothetical protein